MYVNDLSKQIRYYKLYFISDLFILSLLHFQQFFEGVQLKVAQGVKETEISYQMAFSKQELRKVIAQYPAREVKKGLENLYKKVEKHLSEEENLLRGQRAEFRNVPAAWLAEKSPEKVALGRAAQKTQHTDDEEDEEEEAQEFTALTDKEANELGKLFSECDFAIKDAEQFIEQLSRELHDLDGVTK